MLNVSAVSFGNSNPIISREGKYTQNSLQSTALQTPSDSFETPKKKHKGLKAVLGTLVALAAIAGVGFLVGKQSGVFESYTLSPALKNFMQNAGKTVTNAYNGVVTWGADLLKRSGLLDKFIK